MDTTRQLEITRIQGSKAVKEMDRIVVEHTFSVYINGRRFFDFTCTPDNLDALVYGNLFSKGLIKGKQDMKAFSIDKTKAKVVLEKAAYVRGRFPFTSPAAKFTINVETLFNAMKAFDSESPLFAATGGVHSCALYCDTAEQVFMEDIGRHNALDKVIGKALLEGRDISRAFVLTTGRVSKSMAAKALVAGLPILVSRSAPTSGAVELARSCNLTLCGFARGRRVNVYSAPERISNGLNST